MKGIPIYNSLDYLSPDKNSIMTTFSANPSYGRFHNMTLSSQLKQSQIKIVDYEQEPQLTQNCYLSEERKDPQQLIMMQKIFISEYVRMHSYQQIRKQQKINIANLRKQVVDKQSEIESHRDYIEMTLIPSYRRIKSEVKERKQKQQNTIRNQIKKMKRQMDRLSDCIQQERFSDGLERGGNGGGFQFHPHYHFHTMPFPMQGFQLSPTMPNPMMNAYVPQPQSQFAPYQSQFAPPQSQFSTPSPQSQFATTRNPEGEQSLASNIAQFFMPKNNSQLSSVPQAIPEGSAMGSIPSDVNLRTAEQINIFDLGSRKTSNPAMAKQSSISWVNDGEDNDVLELLENSTRRAPSNSGVKNSSWMNFVQSKMIGEEDKQRQKSAKLSPKIKPTFVESRILSSNAFHSKNTNQKLETHPSRTAEQIRRETQLKQSTVQILLKSDFTDDYFNNRSREEQNPNLLIPEKQRGHERRISLEERPPVHSLKASRRDVISEVNNVGLHPNSAMNHQPSSKIQFPQKILLENNRQLCISEAESEYQKLSNAASGRRQIMDSQIKIEFEMNDDSRDEKERKLSNQKEENKSHSRDRSIPLNKSSVDIEVIDEEEDQIMGISLTPVSRISRESPRSMDCSKLLKMKLFQQQKMMKPPTPKNSKESSSSPKSSSLAMVGSKDNIKSVDSRKSSIDNKVLVSKVRQSESKQRQNTEEEEDDDFFTDISLGPMSRISKEKASVDKSDDDFGAISSPLRNSTSSRIIKKGPTSGIQRSHSKSPVKIALSPQEKMTAVKQEQQEEDTQKPQNKGMLAPPVMASEYTTKSQEITGNKRRINLNP